MVQSRRSILGGGSAALLFLVMAFTYNFGANPQIDYPRLLIADTVDLNHIFEDSEIQAAYQIQAAQFQTGMFWSGSAGANLPSTPVSYLRVAALLLDSIACSNARLAGVLTVLGIKMDTGKAAQVLRDQAKDYRATDDDAGAFAIIEQCNNEWSFSDRFWKTIQRNVAV